MRITLIIAEGLRHDALLVLETVGFIQEGPDKEPSPEGWFAVTGELPERGIPELPAIAGVLDWKILPLEDTGSSSESWPWNQNPETD